uniref:Uncharacterized protein n=1 Tax=Anopheles christyi TaxID=43041 RepID=A0A182KI12_9DIPT
MCARSRLYLWTTARYIPSNQCDLQVTLFFSFLPFRVWCAVGSILFLLGPADTKIEGKIKKETSSRQ